MRVGEQPEQLGAVETPSLLLGGALRTSFDDRSNTLHDGGRGVGLWAAIVAVFDIYGGTGTEAATAVKAQAAGRSISPLSRKHGRRRLTLLARRSRIFARCRGSRDRAWSDAVEGGAFVAPRRRPSVTPILERQSGYPNPRSAHFPVGPEDAQKRPACLDRPRIRNLQSCVS
jgi:hypothetical protein